MSRFNIQNLIYQIILFFENAIQLFSHQQKTRIFRTVLWMLVVAFGILTAYVMLSPPQYIDVHISEEIQEEHNGFLDSFMRGISWFGRIRVSTVMVGLSVLMMLILQRKKDALLILSTLITGGLAWVLKTLINRPRPTQNFVLILEETHFKSFPSGHVLFYTAFFGALILILLRTVKQHPISKIAGIAVCFAMILLGAVSRVYLGAHWFTDVLGGFLIGLIYLMIAGKIYFKSERK